MYNVKIEMKKVGLQYRLHNLKYIYFLIYIYLKIILYSMLYTYFNKIGVQHEIKNLKHGKDVFRYNKKDTRKQTLHILPSFFITVRP